MQAMEGQFDVCTEDLFNQTIKLEENNEKQEERLAKCTLELASACVRADASVKKRHDLENGVSSNEEQIDGLEKQLKDAQFMHRESERKYEDISRKMATLDADAAR